MKTLIKIIMLLLFIGMNVNHHLKGGTLPLDGGTFRPEVGVKAERSDLKATPTLKIRLDGITYLDLSTTAPTYREKTVYYVKVGNTISKLEDREGYIIAAKRLGMETIQIIPDGKVYRTVSLDLKKDDQALKDAIEVKLDEIIVAN